jgi:hypothetical protein
MFFRSYMDLAGEDKETYRQMLELFRKQKRQVSHKHETAGHGRSQSGDQGGPLDRALG